MSTDTSTDIPVHYGYGPAIEGPYLDLRTGRGNQLAYARIQGDIDFGRQKYYWFKGSIMANRPGEKTQDLFGAEGFGVIRLKKLEDGRIQRMARQIGLITELRSRKVLSQWHNPYSDETVEVVHVAMEPVHYMIEEHFPQPPSYGTLNDDPPPRIPFVLPWYQHGEWLDMQLNLHMAYPNPLQPDQWPRESAAATAIASEMFTHHVRAADMQNPDITSLDYQGSWYRVTPWLPWMLMGQQPGNCIYAAFMGTCRQPADVLSKPVMDYAEKHYSRYFDAPESVNSPSLSDLQHYARERKPAPAR
ncbi:MAG: DUF1838 domain-containing protein [Gammaproteobacteria bacterium]|nr:DUF1838 domain-containing protein [Gammaproteobacteria bacterium]